MMEIKTKLPQFKEFANSVIVKNEPGTADDKSHLSWCEEWEIVSGQSVTGSMTCSCVGCDQKLDPDHRCGAHVKVVDKNSPLYGKICIVPICKKDNHYTNTKPYRVYKDRLIEYTEIVDE